MADTANVETALRSLKSALRQGIQRRLDEAGLALSVPQAQLLAMIGDEPGISARVLAVRTGRDKAAITRLLGPLLERGWVERVRDRDDARRQRLSLGDSGRDVERRCVEARRQAHEAIFGALDDAEKTQLVSLLQKCLDG